VALSVSGTHDAVGFVRDVVVRHGAGSTTSMEDEPMTPLQDRVEIVIGHAEFLADEAADARCFHLTDRLRLQASRLAIDKEVVDAALVAVGRARSARVARFAQLKAWNQRLEVELGSRFGSPDALLATARVSPVATARFRLRRLSAEQRASLTTIVDGLEDGLAAAEVAEDEFIAAVSAHFVARSACEGRQARLRVDCEKAKAELLAVLPPDAPAAHRIRRRVVRTRRPSTWKPDTTLEGVPVDA
jgi:hypothetical protein